MGKVPVAEVERKGSFICHTGCVKQPFFRVHLMRFSAGFVAVLAATPVFAQSPVAPVNDLPNPYQTVEGWAKLPEGRTWGSTSAVDIDRDGTSVWVAERCG